MRTGRTLAPALAGVLVLGVLYGGGAAQAAEAYGVSAVVLFPVLAWQSKLLLDAEPDVQRRLALTALGSPVRELAAGLGAAAVAGAGTVAVALGALASRAVSRSASYGLTILVCGVVGTIVLGLRGSIVPWLVPPVMGTARALVDGPGWAAVVTLTTHALAWAAVAVAGYAWLRRRRT